MGSICISARMAHFSDIEEPRPCRSARELGSFCAIVISVAPGCTPLRCTRLHGVRVRLSKNSRRLRLRGSTRVGGLQRVGPRSRKRQDARKTARLYYPPIVRERDNNRARRIPESRETRRETTQQNLRPGEIAVTPCARFAPRRRVTPTHGAFRPGEWRISRSP